MSDHVDLHGLSVLRRCTYSQDAARHEIRSGRRCRATSARNEVEGWVQLKLPHDPEGGLGACVRNEQVVGEIRTEDRFGLVAEARL